MRKTILIIILSMVLLAACGAPATPSPTQAPAQPTAAPVEPTIPPAQPTGAPAQATNTPETALSQPASGGQVYYLMPEESTLQYEVGETFLDNNRFAVAVGTTPGVNGSITVDWSAPGNSTLGEFSVDVSQFKSDSNRRDNAIRGRYLESERYPTVTFKPGAITGLPESITPGQEIQFQVNGDVTIREVTQPITFNVTLTPSENELRGVATGEFMMSSFKFGPISVGGILNTEDLVKITLTFVALPVL